MVSRKAIDDFLALKKIAVVGVSRNKKKFGNIVFDDLKEKGYQPYAINQHAREINGIPCYADLASLPEPVEGIVTVIPPEQTLEVVKSAVDAGIRHMWLQQGSESAEVIEFCEQNKLNYISDQCILMFLEPVGSFHKFHRWIWKLLKKLPT